MSRAGRGRSEWLGRVPRPLLIGLVTCSGAGCFLSNQKPADIEPDVPTLSADASVPLPADEPADASRPDASDVPDAVTPSMQADASLPSWQPTGLEDVVSFRGEPGVTPASSSRFVGDLDGDGMDELVVFGIDRNGPAVHTSMQGFAAYLFYGSDRLAQGIDLAAADAILRGQGFVSFSGPGPARPTGDLDGDGYDDFLIAGYGWLHFVLGGPERLSGELDLLDTGLRWTIADLADDPTTGDEPKPARVVPAGDTNGDGLGDFTLTLATDVIEQSQADFVSFTPIDAVFLVLGRAGPLPSGTFEPDWAAARFDASDPLGSCQARGAADLDGDGYSDLLLADAEIGLRVPGRADGLSGTLVASAVGVPLSGFDTFPRPIPDLDGDGRDELASSNFLNQVVRLNYGGAQAPNALLLSTPELPVGALDVADFDGDGRPDLIALAGGFGMPSSGLYVVPGDGERWLGALALGDEHRVIAASQMADGNALVGSVGVTMGASGDVNGDGHADVLATTLDDPTRPESTRVMLILGR